MTTPLPTGEKKCTCGAINPKNIRSPLWGEPIHHATCPLYTPPAQEEKRHCETEGYTENNVFMMADLNGKAHMVCNFHGIPSEPPQPMQNQDKLGKTVQGERYIDPQSQCPNCGYYCTGKSAFCTKGIPLPPQEKEPGTWISQFEDSFGHFFAFDSAEYTEILSFIRTTSQEAAAKAREEVRVKLKQLAEDPPTESNERRRGYHLALGEIDSFIQSLKKSV